MDEKLAACVTATKRAYEDEAEHWDEMWPHCVVPYRRLLRMIELAVPDIIIEDTIKLLKRRLLMLKEARLGTRIH